MKRIVLLFVAVTAIAFLSTSCVKTWICQCTSATTPSANYNYSYEMTSKATAKADCENQQFTGRTQYSPDYTCELQ